MLSLCALKETRRTVRSMLSRIGNEVGDLGSYLRGMIAISNTSPRKIDSSQQTDFDLSCRKLVSILHHMLFDNPGSAAVSNDMWDLISVKTGLTSDDGVFLESKTSLTDRASIRST